jgi:hypothetical protein
MGTRTLRLFRRYGMALALVFAPLASSGCMAAAAAGASVYATSQGSGAKVGKSIDVVAARARDVMAANQIKISGQSSKDDGGHVEYNGKSKDLNVTITLDRESPDVTKFDVTAQKQNLVEFDKDFAKRIADQIVGG